MKIYQVDAFTKKPFSGNPAGVCILAEKKDSVWMQNVASEMNLSETGFLQKREGEYNLRWFTPSEEVNLCGHATLASAHVLFEEKNQSPNGKIKFYTRSGVLKAQRRDSWIELDFPAKPEKKVEKPPSRLTESLEIEPNYIGRNDFDYIVEVENEKTVKNLKPDFDMLSELPVRGVILTSRAESEDYDFISRFFAPAVGVDEDPVTGSAHCCLAPFWAEKLEKEEVIGYQASSRGGKIKARIGRGRVFLLGQAVTVFEGELLV